MSRTHSFLVSTVLILLFSGLVVGVANGDIETGLVAHWAFDEGEGTTAADSSGNGNDGTVQNAVWVEGKIGGALEFNGTDSIVDIPYSSDMTPSVGATISA